MIHYHGGPIKPTEAAVTLWTARHGLTSFEWPEQVALMAEVCQSFVLDNGAFSKWMEEKRKAAAAGEGDVRFDSNGNAIGMYPLSFAASRRARVDVDAYAAFVRQWERHPGFDFAIIPDVIDGTEEDNAKMRARWLQQMPRLRKPAAVVWHLHESLDLLAYLIRCVESGVYERVCLGSSGQYATPGSDDWWQRMEEVREVACDSDGIPHCKLHGLRMLSPTIFSHIPLASADSCNVAVNIGVDKRWTGSYPPVTARTRALVLAERIERHVAAVRWSRRVGIQANLELIG